MLRRTQESSPFSSCDTSDTESCSLPVNSASLLRRQPTSQKPSPVRGHVLRKAKVRAHSAGRGYSTVSCANTSVTSRRAVAIYVHLPHQCIGSRVRESGCSHESHDFRLDKLKKKRLETLMLTPRTCRLDGGQRCHFTVA